MTTPCYLIETKTSSEDITPGSTFWLRTLMDVQIGAYLQAARYMGMDVLGICYDALGKPSQRPLMATPVESRKYTKPTKKEPTPRLYSNQRDLDETPEEYEQRCFEAIAASPHEYYQRQIVVRFESEHRESAADVWQTSQAMREARHLNVYPRHPDACVTWGRNCEFLEVCAGMRSINDPLWFYKETKEHEELELLDDERLRITQSSLRVFRLCPRKYYNRYVLGMRPLAKPESLRMGSSVHRGIEALRKGGGLDAALAALDQTERYSLARERAMLKGYVARWGFPRGITAVEKQFEIELVNPATNMPSRTFRLAGKFDAIYEGDEKDLLR